VLFSMHPSDSKHLGTVIATAAHAITVIQHPRTLEEEDARSKTYLADNGYDTTTMGKK
jgi:hypothetical protein